jgi:hypothetical protein
MVLVIHADAEVTWHAHLRVSTRADVSRNQAQVENHKMKTPVIESLTHIRNKMRARVRKGLAALTALGTPKGLSVVTSNFKLRERLVT